MKVEETEFHTFPQLLTIRPQCATLTVVLLALLHSGKTWQVTLCAEKQLEI